MDPVFDPIRCDDSGVHRKHCPCGCHHGGSNHAYSSDNCARVFARDTERLDRAGRDYARSGLGDEGRRQPRYGAHVDIA